MQPATFRTPHSALPLRIYLDRTPRRHRHHQHPGLLAAARARQQQGRRPSHQMRRQPPSVRPRRARCTGTTTATIVFPTANRHREQRRHLLVRLAPKRRGRHTAPSTPRKARLYPYLQGRGIEICPSLNYLSAQFKLKATGAAYGYGVQSFPRPVNSRQHRPHSPSLHDRFPRRRRPGEHLPAARLALQPHARGILLRGCIHQPAQRPFPPSTHRQRRFFATATSPAKNPSPVPWTPISPPPTAAVSLRKS